MCSSASGVSNDDRVSLKHELNCLQGIVICIFMYIAQFTFTIGHFQRENFKIHTTILICELLLHV